MYYGSNTPFIRRLQELGLIVGTIFTVVRKAPFGGPTEIQYGYTRLAIRPDPKVDIIFVDEE